MAPQRTDSVAALFGAAAAEGGQAPQGGAGAPGLGQAIEENMRAQGVRGAAAEGRYRREYARTLRMTGEEGFCVQFAALKAQKTANELILEWIRPHLEEAWREAGALYRPAPPDRR